MNNKANKKTIRVLDFRYFLCILEPIQTYKNFGQSTVKFHMKNHFSFIRVRYGETDQMGVVHHGNYPTYLELARIEWLDQFQVSYKTMEEEGTMLPVYELWFKYHRPAKFGDTLKVETVLRELPNAKIIFDYRIYNQEKELLTTAGSTLVFMNAKSRRPMKCPEYILEKLRQLEF